MLKLKLQYFGYLKAGGEGDDRGWDGWMALRTQWTWIWASSGSWWWTGRPGVLQSMGLQRDMTNWTELNLTTRWYLCLNFSYSSQDYKHLRKKSCLSVVYPKLTCIEKLACLFLLILKAVKAIMLSTTDGHLPPASIWMKSQVLLQLLSFSTP